jgi:hypothetical protein
MGSNVYTCNGCRRVLFFEDYPPIGNLADGFTCPKCSKVAKQMAAEIDYRLARCGEDGEMAKDYNANKLTPAQLSKKYGCTEEQVLHRVELCLKYISEDNCRDLSYGDWLRKPK